jgi:hypothetical protein
MDVEGKAVAVGTEIVDVAEVVGDEMCITIVAVG